MFRAYTLAGQQDQKKKILKNSQSIFGLETNIH